MNEERGMELLCSLVIPAIIILLVIDKLRGQKADLTFTVRGTGEPTSDPTPTLRDDGPGTYEIVGVDRETKMDCSQVYTATTRANAVAKAELDGIVVTSTVKLR